MRTIKWGIMGLGRIAHKFAIDLPFVEHAELVAVASRSFEKAQAFADKFKVPHAFGSYEELVSWPELDVVYIATPHSEHARCSILCLSHGVSVLCEKPFAMNAQEVSDMIAQAGKADRFLMEAMWSRFMPGIIKVKELIDSGTIGEVITIQADFGFPAVFDPSHRVFNRSLGGGALLDIGIYPVFLALLILGYPDKILATSAFGTTEVDESTSILYQYGHAAQAVLHCTFKANTRTEAFIYGTRGYIHIKGRFHETKEIEWVREDGSSTKFSFDRETIGYNFEAEEVVRCIQSEKNESDLWSLQNSQQLIRLLDETRHAADIHYD